MSFVFEGAIQRKLLYFAFINNSALEKNRRDGAVCLWASVWLHQHYRNLPKSIMCRNNYDNLIYLHISNFLYTIPFILKIQKNRHTYRFTYFYFEVRTTRKPSPILFFFFGLFLLCTGRSSSWRRQYRNSLLKYLLLSVVSLFTCIHFTNY